MHTNVSISKERQESLLGSEGRGEDFEASPGSFVDRILTHGNDICLLLNASVNAYRRLDPHFEAPNQIKASAVDRGSMVRIPDRQREVVARRSPLGRAGRESRTWCCIRSSRSGLDGETAKIKNLRQAERYLPDNIYTAIENFRDADWTTKLLGEDVKARYADLKQASADRCPRLLGTYREAVRGAVPPRGLQPVPLEPVLDWRQADRSAPESPGRFSLVERDAWFGPSIRTSS